MLKDKEFMRSLITTVVGMVLAAWAVMLQNRYRSGQWELAAVDAGHAEFYLDANHERQWRWLPPATTQPAPLQAVDRPRKGKR